MASDFHTHDPTSLYPALISSPQPLAGKLTSLEFHPWELPPIYSPDLLPDLEFAKRFTAIGEVGIDRLRGPDVEIQRQYFEKLLALAKELDKAVVIHCVKSYDAVFAALKRNPSRAMIHGFRSSPQILDELWKRNITVSFHPSIVNNHSLLEKLKNASGGFGFESDADPEISLPELLEQVKRQTGITNIEQITDQNFADFLEL